MTSGKDTLRKNGFPFVTLLTKRSDYQGALTMLKFLKEINVQSAVGKSLSEALKFADSKYPKLLDSASREIGRLKGCQGLLEDIIESEESVE